MKVILTHSDTNESFEIDLSIFETPLRIEEYSDRSIAVYGCTREFKAELAKLGGDFNPNLKGEAGWIFSKRKETAVRQRVAELNKLANLQSVSITRLDETTAIGRKKWLITQVTEGTFHLQGDTHLHEDELTSLGCQKIEDDGENAIWFFTRNKLNVISALVSAINKII